MNLVSFNSNILFIPLTASVFYLFQDVDTWNMYMRAWHGEKKKEKELERERMRKVNEKRKNKNSSSSSS